MTEFNFRHFLIDLGYSCDKLPNGDFLLQLKTGDVFNSVCIFTEEGKFNSASGRLNKLVDVMQPIPITRQEAKRVHNRIK